MIGFLKYLYKERVRLWSEYNDFMIVCKGNETVQTVKRQLDASLEARRAKAQINEEKRAKMLAEQERINKASVYSLLDANIGSSAVAGSVEEAMKKSIADAKVK